MQNLIARPKFLAKRRKNYANPMRPEVGSGASESFLLLPPLPAIPLLHFIILFQKIYKNFHHLERPKTSELMVELREGAVQLARTESRKPPRRSEEIVEKLEGKQKWGLPTKSGFRLGRRVVGIQQFVEIHTPIRLHVPALAHNPAQ